MGLNDSARMPTLGGMTVIVDSSTERPEVAVVRQPIADERHGVVGYELLFGGESKSLDSAADAK